MTLRYLWPLLLLSLSCQPEQRASFLTLTGPAQGTTYQITYADLQQRNFQGELDSLFERVNQSLSTYHTGSLINEFNQSETGIETDDALFWEMLRQSEELVRLSEGAFDPTVMPLVRAWGFGPEKVPELKFENLDSIRALVGFDQLALTSKRIGKRQPGVALDFNAIAQGYTADLIGSFLATKGVQHYMVELGGEVLAKGSNPDRKPWVLGIKQPLEIPGIQQLATRMALQDRSLATSGSYNKFYERDGIKYSHTIDPSTGRPVQHSLLSVSVITDRCAKADAFATVFMVWGVEKALAFLAAHPELDLEAYFISASRGSGWEIAMSPGMKAFIVSDD